MLHQVSTGASGNIQDIRRSIAEGEKYNTKLFDLLGDYCGKSTKTYYIPTTFLSRIFH
jgi:ATP-dependent protease ClpP protease subunit